MKDYKANMKRVAKTVTLAWVMVFALFSSVTAHAAGVGLAKAGDADLQATQNVAEIGEIGEPEGWSEEMTISASDAVNIVYVNEGIMTLAGSSFEWEVPVGTRCVTGSIYFAEGTEVQIACSAIPSDNLYWFGLMHANSDCTVVAGTGAGAHTFTVTSSGYYRIMVENRDSQEMTVMGSYQY